MKESDLENANYALYDERYLNEHEKPPISIDLKTPSRPDEPYSLMFSQRKPRFDPPLHPGENFDGKSYFKSENGRTIGYSIMRIGVPICRKCSQEYDPLTILKKVKDYVFERDGKTYPYLENQIRRSERITS
jgi:hypothetical protein